MSRPPKMPRNDLLDLLTAVLSAKGYDGASLADFSKATGLSKASLYHFFPGGKSDIALQCLIRSGMKLQKWVIAPLQSKAAATDRFNASLEGLARYYSGDEPACLMNILSLTDGDADYTASIKAGLNAWQEALRLTFLAHGHSDQSARQEALSFVRQIQGALVLCQVERSRGPLEDFLKAARLQP